MKTENAFWDTSAIVPLCCVQEFSFGARQAYRKYPKPIIWWGTPVEVRSSFHRLELAKVLDAPKATSALRVWINFRTKSRDVAPNDHLLEIAEEIPKTYGLRALDSFQLAAALIWCGERPRNRPFVTADIKLGEAASDAGFHVVSLA